MSVQDLSVKQKQYSLMAISVTDKCVYPGKPCHLELLDAGLTFARVGFDYNTRIYTYDIDARLKETTAKKVDSTCVKFIYKVLAVLFFPVTLICLALKSCLWQNPRDILEQNTEIVFHSRIEGQKKPYAQVKEFYKELFTEVSEKTLIDRFEKMLKGPDGEEIKQILWNDWTKMQPENESIKSIDDLVQTLCQQPRNHYFLVVAREVLNLDHNLYN